VPYLAAAGELKTKPTQHSVKQLLSYGLQPDVLICRTERALSDDVRRKIALFCNVEPEAVVQAMDAESIYEVPLLLREQGLDDVVIEKLHLEADATAAERPLHDLDLERWIEFLRRLKNPTGQVRIALVGKYVEHQDAYKSISESFIIAGAAHGVQVDVRLLHSEQITAENAAELLGDLSGVLVAPGFGERGIQGKLEAIRYARELGVPFLGICLGMQCAVIEFARNVCGWEDAHSTEFNPATPHPVIDLMAEQKDVTEKGGTMRLGLYRCALGEGTRARETYGAEEVYERHRHRFEVNNHLRYKLKEHGMVLSGIHPEKDLVEIIELPSEGEHAHPWFVGVQFHPEYRTTVPHPHPLFVAFVGAAVAHATAADRLDRPEPPAQVRRIRRASAKVLSQG
jgi:CTP synthase